MPTHQQTGSSHASVCRSWVGRQGPRLAQHATEGLDLEICMLADMGVGVCGLHRKAGLKMCGKEDCRREV